MRKVIYIRVSKEDEEEQNPEDQIPEILHTFKLNRNDCDIIIERMSAYDDSKQIKRVQFIELKNKIELGEVKEVYVYSLERFERNQQRMLEFYFFCEKNGCKMYSALQHYLNNLLPKTVEATLSKNPIYTFLRYLMVLIYGFLAENESYFISVRTKKSFKRIENSTYSKDGNKVGKKFINSAGSKVNISMKKENEMYKFIVEAIIECEKRKISGYYPLIIEKVKKMYDIVVSPAYLSNIKKRIGENNEYN
jgi:DNA invertase Pin-like site-specific DNA recombinase